MHCTTTVGKEPAYPYGLRPWPRGGRRYPRSLVRAIPLSRRPRHRIRLSSPSRSCQWTTHCRACPPLPALGRQPGNPAPGASGTAAAWPDPSSFMVRPIRPSMASMMALSTVRHLRDETAFFLEDSFLPSGFRFWPVRHCLRTRRNRSGVFRQMPFDRLSPRNGEGPRLNVGRLLHATRLFFRTGIHRGHRTRAMRPRFRGR